MSVFRGNQLIVGNGLPGAAGSDGAGIMITDSRNELHNNYDVDGSPTSPSTWNTAVGSFHNVEGYQCSIISGQAVHVEGYSNEGKGGEGGHVEGFENKAEFNEGAHMEGMYNYATIGNGSHVEGRENGDIIFNHPISVYGEGMHLEGAYHTSMAPNLSDGAHQGGFHITANTPMLSMPAQRPGYESTYIESIGLKTSTSSNGEFARIVRNDGSMAISGDMSFTATDSNGDDIGRYTLGEIVQALINAGILPAPNV